MIATGLESSNMLCGEALLCMYVCVCMCVCVWSIGLCLLLCMVRPPANHEHCAEPCVKHCEEPSRTVTQAWVALLEPESHVSKHQSPSAAAPTQGPAAQGCCAVFQALLAGGLQAAAAGAHEDAGEDDVARGGAGAARAEDWMTRMAALGRVVPDRSLLLLHAQLQQHQQVHGAGSSTHKR